MKHDPKIHKEIKGIFTVLSFHIYTRGAMLDVFSGQFFLNFAIIIFCFVVAIYVT